MNTANEQLNQSIINEVGNKNEAIISVFVHDGDVNHNAPLCTAA